MKDPIERQLFFVLRAIQLGEKGRCTAPPNPWVGCVIVKEGKIVGEGYHEAPGKKHAEILAVEEAGSQTEGAAAYVSLEPCAHQGRTPPCVDTLIRCGIKKVVIPLIDPDPFVAGKGIERLQRAGIDVVLGIGKMEAEASLAPYLHHRKTWRPFCVLKTAISMDGRIAAADGSSQWITSEEALADAHFLRAQSQAILVGSGTALADRPQLTVRGYPVRTQPLRVVLDRLGRLPPIGPLADQKLAPTLLVTSSPQQKKRWEEVGAEVILHDNIPLKELLDLLGRRGILQLLIEGGSQIHAAFLKQGLVDRIAIYMGNCLLGDQGLPSLSDFPIPSIESAPRFTLEGVQRLGNSIKINFKPL